MPYVVGWIFFFFGGFVQGCMAFGLAIIVLPALLMVLPATTVVPSLIMLSLTNTSVLLWHLRAHVNWGVARPLVLGAFLGLPPGIYLLKTLDGPGFKAAVGVLIVLLALMLLIGWTHPLRRPRLALYPVGFLGGFLNGSISISGPPVVLFLTSQGVEKEVFRATLAAYFTLTGILATAGFAVSGVLTLDIVLYALTMIPSLAIGSYLGAKFSARISQEMFKRIALVSVGVMGLVLLIQNVLAMAR